MNFGGNFMLQVKPMDYVTARITCGGRTGPILLTV